MGWKSAVSWSMALNKAGYPLVFSFNPFIIHNFVFISLFQGSEGFKNARRGTNFAGQQAAIATAKVSHFIFIFTSVLNFCIRKN